VVLRNERREREVFIRLRRATFGRDSSHESRGKMPPLILPCQEPVRLRGKAIPLADST
jgi:hypothetical protein